MPSVIHHVRRNADKWVSFIVGSAIFLVIAGPRVLLPTSTTWLRWGDSAQHYYGWEFFRRSPLLQFPIGDSPRFGIGYSSSVVYTDSIPLLAIPFKYLTFWFDAEFQYFGVWLLVCYIAQHYVAQRILCKLGVATVFARIAATFFVVAPVFLFRQTILGYGHMALVGQFLVLIALLLALDDRYDQRKWAALLAVSVLVQFYLFVMVAVVWVTVLVRSAYKKSMAPRQVTIRTIVTTSFVTVIMWVVGYFSAGNSSEEGFGIFRADLATFFDPETVTTTRWSSVLPDQPVVPNNVNGTFEGFAFLGLGILIALVMGAVAQVPRRTMLRQTTSDERTTQRSPTVDPAAPNASLIRRLVPASLVCFVFALSNVVTFRVERATLDVPDSLEWIGNTLRASGRFVWPLTYVVMIVALVWVARSLPKSVAIAVVSVLLVLQVVDSRRALSETRERFTEFNYPKSVLSAPDWALIAAGKSRLVTDPPQYKGFVWQDFAEFALERRMVTNASYLSRVDYQQLARVEVEVRNELLTKNIDSDTLYITLPRSGSYASLRHQLNHSDGELAPGVKARFINGMLAVYRDE